MPAAAIRRQRHVRAVSRTGPLGAYRPDATGNLKAVQQPLGHASIQTTGDIYTNWDIDQLAATMADVPDDGRLTDKEPNLKLIPLSHGKPLQTRK